MWAYAQANPEDPMRDQILLACGAVGEANNLALGQRALEAAANVAPADAGVWRMLSRSYTRTNRAGEARGAALVSQAVEAQAGGEAGVAEQRLSQALPELSRSAPQVAAPVAAELGAIAESRNDWGGASARFAEAYRLREQSVARQPNAAASQAIQADAQQLVRALDRSGRTREACERLRQAQEAHDVAAPDQDLLDRCQREFRTQLAPRVEVAPQLQRMQIQRQRAVTPQR